jgi:hypothetical protein
MRANIIFLVCLLPLVSERHAQARPKNKSDDPEMVARKACAEGDFRKGVSILADLYIHSKLTNYIFNQGRCYEQNHQWVSAIDRFREYLRKTPHANSEDVAEAEGHIAECKRLLEEDQPKTAPTPAVISPSPAVLQPSTTVQPLQVSPMKPPAAAVEPGAAMGTTGIVVGSVGLAAVAVAVVLNVKANQLADAGDESGQNSYKITALTCYGVGGAAVVAGIVLYLFGHKSVGAKSSDVSLLPMWTPAGAGFAIRGDF